MRYNVTCPLIIIFMPSQFARGLKFLNTRVQLSPEVVKGQQTVMGKLNWSLNMTSFLADCDFDLASFLFFLISTICLLKCLYITFLLKVK